MLRHLPPAPDARPLEPDPEVEDHPMRRVTTEALERPASWDAEQAASVGRFFDELAPGWDERHGGERLRPLHDALDRGGRLLGPVVELGSGTGLATPALVEALEVVVSVDLSAAMLRLAEGRGGLRIRGDGARLPVADGAVGTVVIVNALLFPAEVDRVLHPQGALVWVCTRGPRTPIYLAAEAVHASLPGRWSGVASEAGEGTWAVLRRSEGAATG